MSSSELVLDLDVLIFALRSVPGTESLLQDLITDITQAKLAFNKLGPLLKVYQSFFDRNSTPKDVQKHFISLLTDTCLEPVKKKTSLIIPLIKPLNFPLPQSLLSTIDMASSSKMDPVLQFEIRLFEWIESVKTSPMNEQDLVELGKLEGMRELNLQVKTGKLLGFLPYGKITDEWLYKDLRLNKTIDLLLKEWKNNNLLNNINVRNEFLTLKNGVIVVTSL